MNTKRSFRSSRAWKRSLVVPLTMLLDVIMGLDVVEKPDGKGLDGWFWDASTTPDTAFFEAPNMKSTMLEDT